MKKKPINPYTTLKNIGIEWADKIKYRHKVEMWHYTTKQLTDHYDLKQLWERVAAAGQLGYDVELEAKGDGLYVYYIKNMPTTPWEFRG